MKLYDRGTGTCFNPPMYTTAAHALEFWSSVEIPDATIAKARRLFNEQQRKDFLDHFQALTEQHLNAWTTANPRPKHSDTKQMKWEADREAEKTRFTEAEVAAHSEGNKFFHSENPQTMGSIDAQQVVRAWFMLRNGPHPDRFPDESAKLDDHLIEIYDGSEKALPLVKKYRLYRFADEIKSVPNPAADAIHQMHDALAELLIGLSQDIDRLAEVVESD
ncbi:hypothetical protein [Homoserinimonas sp. A520]